MNSLSLFDGKVCNRCGEWKPLRSFDVARTCQEGRRPGCRQCERPSEQRKAYMQQWRSENHDHRKAYKKQYEQEHPDWVKEHQQRMYQRHKEKIIARVTRYAQEHSEAKRDYLRGYFQENRAQIREQKKDYRKRQREADPVGWYERERAAARAYREANRERLHARDHETRARRLKAEGRWTPEQWQTLCDYYGNVCVRCGCSKKLHRDHVIPLVKGGRNDIANIQPLCHNCNSQKHVDATDYRPDGGEFARSLL